jgi:MinD-like ATPase involved in chromosome partitioning or flagellar assembly
MDGRRAPQGLDAEDRIALGLTAPRLLYLLVFSMAGWGFLSSQLPLPVRTPPGVVLLAAGAALAWGRFAGRSVDRWLVLYAAYIARPHRSAPVRVAAVRVAAATAAIGALPVAEMPREKPGNLLQLPRSGSRRGARARRVAFFSLRGGTGKSTLASELAAGIAAGVFGEGLADPPRLALLDLDLRASTLCISMGLQGPTLGDVAAATTIDSAVIERSLLRHESGARVMLAPSRVADGGGCLLAAARVLSYLDEQGFDLVILDVGGGIDQLNTYVLQAVDEIYYVFAATAPGIYDLYRGIETVRRLGHRDKIRYVANLCEPGCDLSEVLMDLRGTLTASLPANAAFGQAAEDHRAAALDDLATAQALRPLARSVLGESTWEQPLRAVAGWDQVVAARR